MPPTVNLKEQSGKERTLMMEDHRSEKQSQNEKSKNFVSIKDTKVQRAEQVSVSGNQNSTVMTDAEIRNWTNMLLSAAIAKCGNMEDAQDLTQDTLLALIACKAREKSIDNLSAFLHTVLNRKYYDMLRRKYQLPVITIDDQDVLAGEEDFVHTIIRREDGERIRREVAFLSESYRIIIAKYYFHNRSIREISQELHLPQGTVKSRLDFGRKQLKKGFETMENYTENSYIPHNLRVRNSGICGLAEEPASLTEDDPLAQNLLILAYNKPVSIGELSKAIGVPSAYVEPVVNKLVSGELMKRMGDGRIYTDFIIYQAEDYVKYIKEQEHFAEKYSEAYCSAVKSAINELRQTPIYSPRLERYMLINIADSGVYSSLNNLRSPQIFPNRPNGGRWIAFGTMDQPDDLANLQDQRFQEKEKYRLSGQRCTALDNYLGSGKIKLYNYETALYPCPKFDGYGFGTFIEIETNILKLFYLIKHGISPETVDCDPRILKAIPLLEEQGFITAAAGNPKLLIPCLTLSEERTFWSICEKATTAFARQIREPMAAYVSNHRMKIPAHLKSVPDQKLTMPYEPAPMMFVFEAIKQGIHSQDLGYVCPETFAVME